MKSHSFVAVTALACLVGMSSPAAAMPPQRRVPAEWEPQQAVWLQWPKGIESSYRPEVAQIVKAFGPYQPVHLIVENQSAKTSAQNYLTGQGVPLTNVNWDIAPYDWAWMRDNGPVWVECNGQTVAQDWGFDGWGGLVPYANKDDAVPCKVAAAVGVPCESRSSIIYERGALEFNGSDTVIASWPVFADRNPGVTQASAEAEFIEAFGVTRVIWLYAQPPEDLTKGHVDGICRFIDADTVVVARFVNQNDPNSIHYEQSAQILAAAGLQVLRIDIPGYVNYAGIGMYATYVNWLVGNGVVVMTGFGVPAWDNAAKASVQSYFPGRVVIVVKTLELWYWGGGVHCVTNDQPVTASVASAEVVRAGTPPNPIALLGGVGVAPSVGAAWDLRIDHTTFLPGAALDVLILGSVPTNVSVGALGTLLCSFTPSPLLLTGVAGQSFQLPIPLACELIGLTFVAQGASKAPTGGSYKLTNALDVTIGGS